MTRAGVPSGETDVAGTIQSLLALTGRALGLRSAVVVFDVDETRRAVAWRAPGATAATTHAERALSRFLGESLHVPTARTHGHAVTLPIARAEQPVLGVLETVHAQPPGDEDFRLLDGLASALAAALVREEPVGGRWARRVAVFSHEVRNVTSALRLQLERLCASDGDDLRAALPLATAMARDVERLSRDLVATPVAGAPRLEVSRHTAASLVEEAVARARAVASARGVRVEGRVATDGVVLCDRTQVLQVLRNLVDNAIAASSAGTVVRVSCAAGADGVVFSVEDRGRAMSPVEVRRLRARAQPAREPGRGLGLPIARALVEAHHGTLRCRRRAGGGMVFAFTLATAPSAEPVRRSAPRARAGRSARPA